MALAVLLIRILIYGSFQNDFVLATDNNNVTGYAWGDQAGWLSASGDNYGVTYDSPTNTFSGYGWAETVGWLNFAPQGAFPQSPDYGVTKSADNQVDGWARFCSVFQNGCDGALASNDQRGGWDGWVNFGTPGADSW